MKDRCQNLRCFVAGLLVGLSGREVFFQHISVDAPSFTKCNTDNGEGEAIEMSTEASIPSLPQSQVTSPSFRVLCTSSGRIMRWGSYQIRCQDFKILAESYYPSQLQIDSSLVENARGQYNATIMVKTIVPLDSVSTKTNGKSPFGNVFVDVVDEYHLSNRKIPGTYHVIVQNKLHAREAFAERSQNLVHVVPHWFNSFKADMQSDDPVLPQLSLRPTFQEGDQPLEIAMAWAPTKEDEANFDQVVSLPDTGYELQKIEHAFDIREWFEEYNGGPIVINTLGHNESIAAIGNDPERGAPYLYQLLFRRYDVLLVLGKSMEGKLRYNSVQRAVSQMRSGVPVLLECIPAHGHLCNKYPCGFRTAEEMKETLERMKSLEVRQECARIGIEITKSYSPSRIVHDYLKVLGFKPRH